MDIHDRVASVIDLQLLACWNPARDFWIFFLCDEAIQQVYGTSLVLLRCPLVPVITHRGAPKVFLIQWKLESHHMALAVTVRLKASQQPEYNYEPIEA